MKLSLKRMELFTKVCYGKKNKTRVQIRRFGRNNRFEENVFKTSFDDSTHWSFILYEIFEILEDRLPIYRTDSLTECYNEALLRKKKLPKKEKIDVLKTSRIPMGCHGCYTSLKLLINSKRRCHSVLILTILFLNTKA